MVAVTSAMVCGQKENPSHDKGANTPCWHCSGPSTLNPSETPPYCGRHSNSNDCAPMRLLFTLADALPGDNIKMEPAHQQRSPCLSNTVTMAWRNRQMPNVCAWQLCPCCIRWAKKNVTRSNDNLCYCNNFTQRKGSSSRMGPPVSHPTMQKYHSEDHHKFLVLDHRARLRVPLPRKTHVGNRPTHLTKHHSMQVGCRYWFFFCSGFRSLHVPACVVPTCCPWANASIMGQGLPHKPLFFRLYSQGLRFLERAGMVLTHCRQR